MNTNVLPGFQELLPKEQIAFNRLKRTIEDIYQLYGFRPIETPALERAEVLLTKGGGETDKQIYQFEKGDTKLAMKFDLTVPLARYVANHQNDLVFPFKRYAIDRAYRGEKPQKGRLREFYQCDIDVIGRDTLDISYDAEMPSIISKIFTTLGFDFTIKINNRKILNGFLEKIGVANNIQVLRILDSIEKVDLSQIRKELEESGLGKAQIENIFDFYKLNKLENTEIIKALKEISREYDTLSQGVEELEQVMKEIDALGISKNVKIDISIARGLDYYTGTVYETVLDKYPEFGSVCGGGRYDDLASYYTSSKFPGVGISLGLGRLFDQLKDTGEIKMEQQTPSKVMILPLCDSKEYVFEIASLLREKGIPTEIAQENNMKKELNYANKLKIPYVIFIGEDEIAKNTYTLKDMNTGEQKSLIKEDLLKQIPSQT